jgi:hypothetical protein
MTGLDTGSDEEEEEEDPKEEEEEAETKAVPSPTRKSLVAMSAMHTDTRHVSSVVCRGEKLSNNCTQTRN